MSNLQLADSDMKILLITPIFPPVIGGPATYTLELSRRLKRVDVLAFGDEGEGARMIPVRKGFSRKIPIVGSMIRQADFARNLLQYRGMDIWYIQGPLVVGFTASLVGFLLRKKMVMKFVGDIAWETASQKGKTDKNLDEFLQSGSGGFLRFLQGCSFRRVHKIVVPSEYLRNVLVSYYKIPRDKIHVIYNAVEVSGKKEVRSKKSVVTVGRLVPHKNIAGIIEAVSMLRGYNLRIVGDGPEWKNLHESAKKLKAKVEFLGALSREETLREIASAEVFVLNSNYEGLPHTVVEAMYLKTPVVATDILGTTEIATPETATLAQPNNPGDLADKIKNHGDKTEEAYRWVQGRFNWKENIGQLEELFFHLDRK